MSLATIATAPQATEAVAIETIPVQTSGRTNSDLEIYLADRLRALSALAPTDPARSRLRDDVICACLPATKRLASRFFGRGETPEDLIQIATIGLIKAVDRFDTDRETQFMSYATPTIIGEIKRHFRDKGWSVRVSRPMQELYLQINQALPDLAQDLGRTPTTADIAERIGVSVDEAAAAMNCGHAYSARSLSAPIGNPDSISLADTLGGEDPQMESVADRTTLQALLAEVPEREQLILKLRFFENLTQAEIADRIGVSQMHVSRLLTRTLAEMRTRLIAGE